MKTLKRSALSLLLVLIMTLGTVIVVKAHANLVRSVPEAGAVLDQSPPEVLLEFSEDLDPAFSKVELFDSSGSIIIAGPGAIDPATPRVMRLQIETLADGVYTAVWLARSAADGHNTNGSVAFSVGAESPQASRLPPPGTPDPATAMPSIGETIIRWLSAFAACLAVGSPAFYYLAWRPAYREEKKEYENTDLTVKSNTRLLSYIGLIVLGISTLIFAIMQAASAAQTTFFAALGAPLVELIQGRTGIILGERLVLIIVAFWLVSTLSRPSNKSNYGWPILFAVGGFILLTFSLQSHAAADSSLGLAEDWLHFSAASIWLGGLPALYLALKKTSFPAYVLVPRFSRLALASVSILAVTGVYNVLVYVKSVEALLATTYGRALIIKSVLFAFLVGLGAINFLYLSPKLKRRGSKAVQWLRRTVRIEMTLGLVLLIVVGLLMGVARADEALKAHQDQGVIETSNSDGVRIVLRVFPGIAGVNELGVEINDVRPGANGVEPEVLLRLTMTSMNMGIQQLETVSPDELRYSAQGSFFSMEGLWKIEVIVRKPGFNDVTHTFLIRIDPPFPWE